MKEMIEKIKKTQSAKLSVYLYSRFFKNRPLALFFLLAIFINFLSFLTIIFSVRPSQGIIPIHYIPGVGVDKTGPWYWPYYLVIFLLIINTINFLIAKFLKTKEENKAAYILVGATILLNLLMLLAVLLITFNI